MKPEMPAMRDEVQHRMLSAIVANKTVRDAVVFRGGTMLRCCVYNTFRYSEDMDFYIPDGTQSVFRKTIAHITETLREQLGLPYMKFIRMDGGADYILFGESKNEGWVNFDVATLDSRLRMETEKRTLAGRYRGLDTDTHIVCLSLVDVMATKYNCLANRPEPRDLYDFWRLSQNKQLPDQGWRKYRETWEAYEAPVPPEEIFKALKGWEKTYKTYWERESKKLSFPVNPGPDAIYANVETIFERVCKRKV